MGAGRVFLLGFHLWEHSHTQTDDDDPATKEKHKKRRKKARKLVLAWRQSSSIHTELAYKYITSPSLSHSLFLSLFHIYRLFFIFFSLLFLSLFLLSVLLVVIILRPFHLSLLPEHLDADQQRRNSFLSVQSCHFSSNPCCCCFYLMMMMIESNSKNLNLQPSPGFSGTNCQENVNDCPGHLCQNGASCVDGVNSYTCQCPPSFTGPYCNQDVDECALRPSVCKNGATCTNTHGGFSCICVNGWTGSDCSENIDDCAGAACFNGATCHDRVGSFFCQCAPGKLILDSLPVKERKKPVFIPSVWIDS